MQARSALFDLYGDHLRTRGGQAPVAALVRLLACLDIAAPAVRTAVSRMVRQGWLEPVTTDQGRGYRLTQRGVRRPGGGGGGGLPAAPARGLGRSLVDRAAGAHTQPHHPGAGAAGAGVPRLPAGAARR